MLKRSDGAAPKFSRLILIETIPPDGLRADLEAHTEALPPIAQRLGVPAVLALAGRLEVQRSGAEIHVEGDLSARLSRECVASLELFEERVDESFALRFAAANSSAGDIDDENAPEPLEGDTIDLAEILIQQLSLAMNPYPRKPDAQSLADSYGGAETASPFAGLRDAFAKSSRQE